MKQHWHWTSSCRQWQLLLSSCPTTHKSWYGLLKTHVRGETDHFQKKSGRLRIIEFFRFDFPGSWSPSWLGGRLVSHPSCPKMVMHESMSDWRMILPTGIVHVDRLFWKLLALFKEMIARSDFFWDAVISTPTATVSFSKGLNQLWTSCFLRSRPSVFSTRC